MRATCRGARSGRISIATLPCVVSRIIVFSVLVICRSFVAMLLFDGGFLDVVQIGKVLLEISVPLLLDSALLRSPTRRSPFAVAAEQRIHHVHPGDDLAKRREALTVEPGVVGEIDEDLAGTRIRAGSCKRDVSAFVALLHGIIVDGRSPPRSGNLRVAVDAELYHEAADPAEEAG